MDPLSITAGAIALAANVLRSAAFVKEAVDQVRDAPTLARDIEHEIKIVQAALRQVEAALQRDPQAIRRLSLDDVFELSVEGCRDTLQEITHEFETLFGRHDWRFRLALWWNSGEIRRLLGRLESKKGSLVLLVQALSLHSVQEMQELLQQNMRTLDIARLGLDDMVHSYPAYTAKDLDSTASGIDSGDSMLGDRESVVSNTRFIFDDVCFDSKPYRHTVARVSVKKGSNCKRRDASAFSSSPPLLAARETEAEADTTISHAAPTPIHLTGVPSEEHEAVLMKLREAEALIRTLQGRTQQLGTASRESPTVADPSRYPVRVEDNVNEPLQGMTPQIAEITSTKQPRINDDLPVRPTTKRSRHRTTRSVEVTQDFLPIRNVAQNRPKITTRSDRKASSAMNEPSTPSNESLVAAGPTRSPGRSRPTPPQREIELLTEYFKGGEQKRVEPSIKVHFTPREKGKPQQIIITSLHNGTTQILDANTGREVISTSTLDTQAEDAPTATGQAVDAATSLGPLRPFLAANGEEERSIPNAISMIPPGSSIETPEPHLSQTRARSAVARTMNPLFGYGTSGTTNRRHEKCNTSAGPANKTSDPSELWSTRGHVHSLRTISAHKQSAPTDPGAVKVHVPPEPDALEPQRAPHKLTIEDNARQMTFHVKEEAHDVFQSIVPPARPNPPLLVPIDNNSQGSDISRNKQTKKRAVTVLRPRLGYDLHMMEVERAIGDIMENTAQSVRVSSMPTENGAHPQSRGLLEARLAKKEEATKKRSVFIRAFKGVRVPGNELATIEEILGKLLVEVNALKAEAQQDIEGIVDDTGSA